MAPTSDSQRRRGTARPLVTLGVGAEPLARTTSVAVPTPSLLADRLPPHAPVEPALAPARAGWCDLTRRETEIVQLIADGAGNKQVAAALRISEWTVETHVRRIFIKLGVRSRAAMVYRYALFKSSTAGPR